MVGMTATPFFIYNQLGGSATMSGVIGATQAAAYALACLMSAGFVSRAKNGLSWALVGLVLYTGLFCLMPVYRNAWFCGVVSTLACASLALVWPALHSWVGGEPDPAIRSRNMGWFNIAWSFGFAISPLFAGPFYDIDYRLPFVLLFALGAVAFVLVKSMPHERSHFADATEEMILARASHDRSSEIYLTCGWSAVLFANALAGITRSVYPKRVDDLVAAGELRFLFESSPAAFLSSAPATKYSWLAFILAFSTALTFLVMGRTTGWRHRFSVLFWIQVLSAAAFWMLAWTKSLAIMLACFSVVGVYLGVAFFSGVYYSLGNPALKHRRAAMNEAAVGTGGFAGSLIVGYLAGHYGHVISFQYTPLFMLAAIVLQFFLIQHGKQRMERLEQAKAAALAQS
ncbi:MAG: MFS transporter [Candidatus Hydrogenedentes bacterium]|nr:MFS transporter [Candidatus Hydrogenedentota bacterium]